MFCEDEDRNITLLDRTFVIDLKIFFLPCQNKNVWLTMQHIFLFVCPSYHLERQILYDNIIRNAGADVFSTIISNWDIGLNLLLGNHDDLHSNYFCSFIQKAWMIRSSHSNV